MWPCHPPTPAPVRTVTSSIRCLPFFLAATWPSAWRVAKVLRSPRMCSEYCYCQLLQSSICLSDCLSLSVCLRVCLSDWSSLNVNQSRGEFVFSWTREQTGFLLPSALTSPLSHFFICTFYFIKTWKTNCSHFIWSPLNRDTLKSTFQLVVWFYC